MEVVSGRASELMQAAGQFAHVVKDEGLGAGEFLGGSESAGVAEAACAGSAGGLKAVAAVFDDDRPMLPRPWSRLRAVTGPGQARREELRWR